MANDNPSFWPPLTSIFENIEKTLHFLSCFVFVNFSNPEQGGHLPWAAEFRRLEILSEIFD